MTTEHQDKDDDVVVIEQRDKRTLIYIAVAATLGIAFGGLIGSSLNNNEWQTSYQALEARYMSLERSKTDMTRQVEAREAAVDTLVAEQVQTHVTEQKQEVENKLNELQHQISELEKVNLSLEARLKEQKETINQNTLSNEALTRQNEMQATVFARSRELFQRELIVKQELAALEKEREELQPKIETFKKQCDIFLEGKSWDAKSDSCDRLDEANSRLSHIDQMVEVYRLDLREIEVISAEMGL